MGFVTHQYTDFRQNNGWHGIPRRFVRNYFPNIMKYILASGSPRRKELLSKITTEFTVIPSEANEVTTAAEPRDMCRELACRKALDIFNKLPVADRTDSIVIGCDTVVDLDGKVLGKPHSAQQATQMLQALSARTHKVHTGYCIVSTNKVACGTESTLVTFRTLSSSEIDAYVASGAPMDKAGAYGIQETDFVANYDGSFDNVMGLPTETLAKLL